MRRGTGAERDDAARDRRRLRPRPGRRRSAPCATATRRIYFGGLLVSNIGTWLQLTAMSLLVYDLTGKSTDLGITVALQFLPMLVLGAWAGAVADRRDKRTLAMLTQSLLAVQALVLGVVVLAGLESVAVIWALTFALGVAQRVREPGPAGPRHRARRAPGHRQRDVAEHGGDDGVADLRSGARRVPRRADRQRLVLRAQRRVLRRGAGVAAALDRGRAAHAAARAARRAAGARGPARSSATTASCS